MKAMQLFRMKFLEIIFCCFWIISSCTSERADHKRCKENAVVSHMYSTAELYVTSKNSTDRLTDIGKIDLIDLPDPSESNPTIMIDPSKTFQTIVGFGGALTDASAETLYKLTKAQQNEILKAYFDPDSGIGYTICRTHINSCDFSSESYAYDTVANDTSLSHFNIEHDLKYRLPMLKEALRLSKNQLKILASVWSPPAWMKTNNNMLHGGKLKPAFYQTWANYYVRFMKEYQKEGISTWALTVQNEPAATQIWESCVYTPEEERDFVKNFLGPALKASDFNNVKLLVWDHNRGLMYQRAKVVYDDPDASKYVWGTAFHWYVGDHFENVKLLHEAYPDKELLFTEGCIYPFKTEGISDWKYGEQYATSMINDLNNSTAGWIDWNILLDETGGPNHVSNFCFAPVIADTKSGKVSYMNSFYYLGHFSKFIRPGAKRIIAASNIDKLLSTAFLNTDGSLAIIVLNSNPEDENIRIWLQGKALDTKILANSIISLVVK